jgi:hypothetical protein
VPKQTISLFVDSVLALAQTRPIRSLLNRVPLTEKCPRRGLAGQWRDEMPPATKYPASSMVLLMEHPYRSNTFLFQNIAGTTDPQNMKQD